MKIGDIVFVDTWSPAWGWAVGDGTITEIYEKEIIVLFHRFDAPIPVPIDKVQVVTVQRKTMIWWRSLSINEQNAFLKKYFPTRYFSDVYVKNLVTMYKAEGGPQPNILIPC